MPLRKKSRHYEDGGQLSSGGGFLAWWATRIDARVVNVCYRGQFQPVSFTWNRIMEMMKVDPEIVRKLREERAWSQEHLAAVAGLSLRTVQRVESDANASAETRMSLATAFGVDLESLKPPSPVTAEPPSFSPVQGASAAASSDQPVPAKKLSYLYYRLLRFLVIVGLLVGLDVYESGSVTWSRWVLVFGIALCGLRVIKAQFVDPGELRSRRSVSRNV